MPDEAQTVTGEMVDETARFDLRELCEICGVPADHLLEMVEAGIIRPEGDGPTLWRFSAVAVMRSRKALRLRRDLDINMPGLAVVLDLLEKVDRLQYELKSLRQRVDRLEE